LLGLFVVPENGGDMFLQNIGWLSTDYIPEDRIFQHCYSLSVKYLINKYAELIMDRLSADVFLISEVMLISCSGLAKILFPNVHELNYHLL
jgi:hypothetical protein